MKIKNIGRKIIGFGQTSVLPDQTATIPDTFKENPTLLTFVELGYVEVIEEKTKTNTGKNSKGSKTGGGKTETTETETDEETEAGKE